MGTKNWRQKMGVDLWRRFLARVSWVLLHYAGQCLVQPSACSTIVLQCCRGFCIREVFFSHPAWVTTVNILAFCSSTVIHGWHLSSDLKCTYFIARTSYTFLSCLQAGQWLKSVGLLQGRRPSGAVLHSSRESAVWHPCSDFTDMLRCLINCRIIIIMIIIMIIIIIIIITPGLFFNCSS